MASKPRVKPPKGYDWQIDDITETGHITDTYDAPLCNFQSVVERSDWDLPTRYCGNCVRIARARARGK